MSTDGAAPTRALRPALVRILQQAERRGEHTVNWFRLGFYALSAAMFAANLGANTPAANLGFTIQVGTMLAYAVGVEIWLRRHPDRPVGRLKYLSITVDLVALHASILIMSTNYQGVIEYFHGFVPEVLVLWNIFAALRFSTRASVYSGLLSLVLSSAALVFAASSGQVEISEVTTFGAKAIHLGDEAARVVFIALPAFFGTVIARASRRLVVRAEEQSQARMRLEQQKEQLSKYLSRELVDAVLADPELMRLGGARRVATVVFCDIRNFTPLAEREQPERVVQILNDHFTHMVEVVFRYGGTLDKFLGDGLMAVFSAPTDLPDHELRAVVASLEMLRVVDDFNTRHAAATDGTPLLEVGVGIASGPIVAGNIGSPERMDYTAIGDTVNFAARLEGLTKVLGTPVVLSATTHAALAGRLPTRALPPTPVKGKTGTPPLFAIDLDAVTAEVVDALASELDAEVRTERVLPVAHGVH